MHLFSIFLPASFIMVTFSVFKILRKSPQIKRRNIRLKKHWKFHKLEYPGMNVKNCEFCKDYVNDWIWDHLFAINLLQKLANRKSNMQNIINFNSIIIFKICQKSTSTPLPSYSHAINSFDEWDRTVFIADRKSVVRVL